MAGSALLLVASAVVRVASLNLCSDEYALLLARRGELVSVTRLAKDPAESMLADRATSIASNRGRLEDVLSAHPTLLLTMGGGGGRSSGTIARRLHLAVLDLPFPASLDDVAVNLRRVAGALGDPRRAAPLLDRLAALRRTIPPRQRDSIWLGNGGSSLSPGSLSAQWMALAGLRERPLPGGRVSLETLVTYPPNILIKSNYRSGQQSQGQRWLSHPLLSRTATRSIVADGRRWTCAGPLVIDDIERFRRELR